MRRLLIFLVVAGGFVLSCGASKREDRTEIEFWTMQLTPNFTDYVQNLITRYESQNPGVRIRWVDVPWTSLEPRLLTALASRRAPDVVNLSPDLMLKFAQNRQLVPVEDYVSQEQRGRYFPRIWRSNSYQGVVYAIPWYLATDVTMYNREVFEQAELPLDTPLTTFDALARAGRVIREKTGRRAFMFAWGEPGRFKGYLFHQGIPLVNEDLTAAFNVPQSVEELLFWRDLLRDGVIPRETFTEEHQKTIEMYSSGQIAILVNGPQFLSRIKELNPTVYRQTLIQPAVRGKSGKVDVAIQNLVVPRQSDDVEQAIRFALYVTNAENQLEFCQRVTIFPSVIEVAQDPYFTSQEGDSPEEVSRRVVVAQLEDAERHLEPFPNMGEMDRIIMEMVQAVCLGGVEPEAALREAETKWNRLVEEMRREGRIP